MLCPQITSMVICTTHKWLGGMITTHNSGEWCGEVFLRNTLIWYAEPTVQEIGEAHVLHLNPREKPQHKCDNSQLLFLSHVMKVAIWPPSVRSPRPSSLISLEEVFILSYASQIPTHFLRLSLGKKWKTIIQSQEQDFLTWETWSNKHTLEQK